MSDGSDPEFGEKGLTRPAATEVNRGRTGVRKVDRIATQLRQVYDEALRDPIPEDMLKLLDQLDGDAGERK